MKKEYQVGTTILTLNVLATAGCALAVTLYTIERIVLKKAEQLRNVYFFSFLDVIFSYNLITWMLIACQIIITSLIYTALKRKVQEAEVRDCLLHKIGMTLPKMHYLSMVLSMGDSILLIALKIASISSQDIFFHISHVILTTAAICINSIVQTKVGTADKKFSKLNFSMVILRDIMAGLASLILGLHIMVPTVMIPFACASETVSSIGRCVALINYFNYVFPTFETILLCVHLCYYLTYALTERDQIISIGAIMKTKQSNRYSPLPSPIRNEEMNEQEEIELKMHMINNIHSPNMTPVREATSTTEATSTEGTTTSI